MRRNQKMLPLLALAILMAHGAGAASAQSAEIVFVTGEWEPYVGEKLPGNGAAAELVAAICKAADIKLSLRFFPWPRAEKMVADGEAFAAFPYAVTEDRRKVFDFSESLFFAVNPVIYYAKNPKLAKLPEFARLEDLRAYTVGVPAGSFIEAELKKAGVKVETQASIENLVKMLVAGRVDFIIDESAVLNAAANAAVPAEASNIKALPRIYGDKVPNALIVSRKYPGSAALLQRFDQGLAAIKKSGEYDRIADKYKLGR